MQAEHNFSNNFRTNPCELNNSGGLFFYLYFFVGNPFVVLGMFEFLTFAYSKFMIQVSKVAHFEQTLHQEQGPSTNFEISINESNQNSLHSNLAQIIHVRPINVNSTEQIV